MLRWIDGEHVMWTGDSQSQINQPDTQTAVGMSTYLATRVGRERDRQEHKR